MENLTPGRKQFILSLLAIIIGSAVAKGWVPASIQELIAANPDEALGLFMIGYGALSGYIRTLTNKAAGLSPMGKPLPPITSSEVNKE